MNICKYILYTYIVICSATLYSKGVRNCDFVLFQSRLRPQAGAFVGRFSVQVSDPETSLSGFPHLSWCSAEAYAHCVLVAERAAVGQQGDSFLRPTG